MANPLQQIIQDVQGGAGNIGKSIGSTIPGTKIRATDGWYVAIGCIGAILLASTPVAPVVMAVMTVALLYQLENLLQGT